MSEAPALELRDVSKTFGKVVALEHANLIVRRGTVHALLGENGAGKTTAMRIAYGMTRADAGEVRVDGIARHFSNPADALAAGVGMVQQHPSNVAAMTVWENVMLGGTGRLDPSAAMVAVRSLAAELGFTLSPDARVADLSVSAQQRLEILRAIHRRARVLILDEPTAILAPDEARDLYGWLRAFADKGGTAVVVTHKLDEARRFTDDLTVLRAGRTVRQAPSATITPMDLTTAMIGGSLSAFTTDRRSQAGDVVLRADHITLRTARGVSAIRGADFDVRAGEIVGVAGVEGSGHHELLLAIAGRFPVHEGKLELPTSISIVPEDRHRDGVVLAFTLTENDAIKDAGRRRGRMRWRDAATRVATMMERHDVRARGPATVMKTLSGGNQQKFVLARELESQPTLIVAENPTRGLDIRAAAFVRDELRAARSRGAAVVMYSSDLDEILDVADRVLVVHSGSVSAVALDRARIGAAMLGAG